MKVLELRRYPAKSMLRHPAHPAVLGAHAGARRPAPHAVQGPMAGNRVEVTGFGVLPCAGAYAEVLAGGSVRTGDAITLR